MSQEYCHDTSFRKISTMTNHWNGVQCIFWLNSFPHKDGVHATMSARVIMTGQKIMYDKHCKVEFRSYVQTR